MILKILWILLIKIKKLIIKIIKFKKLIVSKYNNKITILIINKIKFNLKKSKIHNLVIIIVIKITLILY
jgi:hypothetical protein